MCWDTFVSNTQPFEILLAAQRGTRIVITSERFETNAKRCIVRNGEIFVVSIDHRIFRQLIIH